jgi:hypothetical protein
MNNAEITQAGIFVVLFGLAFLFAAAEEIGLAILFCFLAFTWVFMAETVIGDGGRTEDRLKNRIKVQQQQQKRLKNMKARLQNAKVKSLFRSLDNHIEQLNDNYSKTTERVLIGHKKEGEGTWLEIDVQSELFRLSWNNCHLIVLYDYLMT